MTTSPAPDLAVSSPERVDELVRLGARSLLVQGHAPVPASFRTRTYLALPEIAQARLLVPLDRLNVLRYVLETRWVPTSRVRAVRKALVARAPKLDAILRRVSSQCLTVAGPAAPRPFLLAAAETALETGPLDDFFLVCGEGDSLARGVFVSFRTGGTEPEWVVKFARARGYAEPFDKDERGLGLVAAAGGPAAERAPKLLHRFAVDGFASSVESAAAGTLLTDILRSTTSAAVKQRVVEAVAAWIVDVGLDTFNRGSSVEIDRLRRAVLSQWPLVPATILTGLDELPSVLQHNDLGAWNIVVDGTSFTVLDWESARPAGLPLWDLWYFLADALPLLDGDAEDRVAAFRRLFRGEAPSSQLLFRWTRRAVGAFAIPPETVGRLATLCWLHHGLSHVGRSDALSRHADADSRRQWPPEHFPRVWLDDEALGSRWSRWREEVKDESR